MTDNNALALEALKKIAEGPTAGHYAGTFLRDIALDALREIESTAPAAGEVEPDRPDPPHGMSHVEWMAWKVANPLPNHLTAEQADRYEYVGHINARIAFEAWRESIGLKVKFDASMGYHGDDYAARDWNVWKAAITASPPTPSATSADLPSGPVLHAPSGVVFDEVIAAAVPEDLTALTPQSPTVMDEKGEREAFEAKWLKRPDSARWQLERTRRQSDDYYLGDYCVAEVQASWEVWQARATLPAAQPEAETSAEKAFRYSHAELIAHGERERAVGYREAAERHRAAQADAPVAGLKDHEIREVISAATKVAKECGHAEQLRERLKDVLLPALRGVVRSDAPVAEPVAWLVYLPSQQCQHVFDSQDDPEYLGVMTNNEDAQLEPLYTRPPAPEDGKDAARYRVLRNRDHGFVVEQDRPGWRTTMPVGKGLDDAIDAAVAQVEPR